MDFSKWLTDYGFQSCHYSLNFTRASLIDIFIERQCCHYFYFYSFICIHSKELISQITEYININNYSRGYYLKELNNINRTETINYRISSSIF